jgi:hypothetical protein
MRQQGLRISVWPPPRTAISQKRLLPGLLKLDLPFLVQPPFFSATEPLRQTLARSMRTTLYPHPEVQTRPPLFGRCGLQLDALSSITLLWTQPADTNSRFFHNNQLKSSPRSATASPAPSLITPVFAPPSLETLSTCFANIASRLAYSDRGI